MTNKQITAKQFRAQRDGKKTRKKNKYNVSAAADRRCDGRTFDSKKEMLRYKELKELRAAGAVLWYSLQPTFMLPGGIVYKADFIVAWQDGCTTVEDVKGGRTAMYKLKKKQVEALYNLEIVET